MRKYRFRLWHGGVAALAVVGAVVAALVITSDEPAVEPPAQRSPGPPGEGPITLVTIGDSSVSGEGTQDYLPETDGQDGNWCHRSPQAVAHVTEVPGIEETVNLACSGAATSNVRLTDRVHYTEPSQAQQLRELLTDHRVAVVVVAIGGNDDPQFAGRVTECGASFFTEKPCSTALARRWQSIVNGMTPKVIEALADIRTVLDEAGYRREDYDLVLQSYPSPVSPHIPEYLRSLNGCPFLREDLRWIRDEAVPMISEAMRVAAEAADARFLDLSRAGHGREACVGGDTPDSEWFSRLLVRWDDLEDVDRATHTIQESFHANIAGHWQIARCLTEFLRTTAPQAACERGPDGNLRAVPPAEPE